MQANSIDRIYGIVNGTTNYILTKMDDEGRDFDDVLKEAQELGYAEANPTSDVEGYDARYKLSILASMAFHARVPVDKIDQKDDAGQQAFGCVIEKGILAIAGGISSSGTDDGLGRDFRILFCLRLVGQVVRLLQIPVHVFVYHAKDIVAVGAGRIAQVQNRNLVTIVFLRDRSIIL